MNPAILVLLIIVPCVIAVRRRNPEGLKVLATVRGKIAFGAGFLVALAVPLLLLVN